MNEKTSLARFSVVPLAPRRIFLVGCPRSGTTLLQCLLAAHSEVASFPETRFVLRLVGQFPYRLLGQRPSTLRGWLQHLLRQGRIWCNLADRTRISYVKTFLASINRPELIHLYPQHAVLLSQQLAGCISILDALAQESNKSCWLEKTPDHLAYVDIIENLLPDVRFVHIIRSGEDVVASIYDAANRYPESWNSCYQHVPTCVTHWNRSILNTRRYRSQANHWVVSYESLVRDAPSVLRQLCQFLELKFEENMVESFSHEARHLVLGNEEWKSGVTQAIKSTAGTKFFQVFGPQERQYITEHLLPISDDDFS